MTHFSLYIIPALPLLGFLLNGMFGKKLGKLFVNLVGVGSIFASFFFSLLAFSKMLNVGPFDEYLYTWFSVGTFQIPITLSIDQLSGLMLLIVTGVGSLIHLYSVGYMKFEKGYYRYFSYLNLFIFFMLILILSDNMVGMFLGWEGVGLCSYLLIGFYIDKKSAGNAAKKAFIVNRIGDFGLIIGMLFLFYFFGSLNFKTINQNAINLPSEFATWITLLLFLGAIGKSAQIPLYVWLPDAMEGPTPVSALIHAATMVTSGLYLIARLSHLFILSETTLFIIAILGAFTAIFAATIALVQNDIKKILAYSTVSQLGYMFLAMGVGAFSAGIFHVMTHAFFKALLFLGAGSVIYALHHEQNITKMGGLKNKLPITWFIFSVGTWALAGLPLMSGFFSKDEILWQSFSSPLGSIFFWIIGFITAGLTSFYMYRLVNQVFYGESKQQHSSIQKPTWIMNLPLLILAFFSIFIGYIGLPFIFQILDPFDIGQVYSQYFGQDFFASVQMQQDGNHHFIEIILMLFSVTIAIGGLFLAKKCYTDKTMDIHKKCFHAFKGIPYKIVSHKYYVDLLYQSCIVTPIYWISDKVLFRVVEVSLIDKITVISTKIVSITSSFLRLFQTGIIHHYLFVILLSIVIILSYFL